MAEFDVNLRIVLAASLKEKAPTEEEAQMKAIKKVEEHLNDEWYSIEDIETT